MGLPAAPNTLEVAPLNKGVASRYGALIRLAEVIRSHSDEKDLFQIFADELHQVVPFDGICQFDAAANWVQWHFVEPHNREFEALPSKSFPKEETLAWWVYRNQQPLIIRFVGRETRFPRMVERLTRVGIRSVCALPLSTAHRQLGSLVFGSHIEDAYSTEDQQFLSLIANQVAVAMDDARAQQRLRLLLDLTNRVMTKLDLRELLQEISANIRQVMLCDAVGVCLPDPANGELQLYAEDIPGHREITESAHVREAAEYVFQTGEPVNFTEEQLAADPVVAAAGHNSLRLLPLTGHDRVLGVLGLASSRMNGFTEDDLRFLDQVASQLALAIENALAYKHVSELKDKLAQENVYLESEIRSELHFEDIVGNSNALRRVLREVETVAPLDSTVLIYGETGTGKELIARALHNLSSRKSNAFVKLNCAAIPTGLLESELFGHEKGAFTGAITQRAGRFELAHRGTIFLDEAGEIPLELQPKLLRVLQEREFERLGSTRVIRIDARLIAATNRDLKAMVDDQKFRSDLYYRLNVFPIRVPALRERPEDIPLLVRHFVQQFSRRNNRVITTIPSESMEGLVRYYWPGNIRELQNVIERAVITSKGPVLRVSVADHKSDLSETASLTYAARAITSPANRSSLQDMLDETERAQILRALEATNGVVGGPKGAAARLGIKRTTLHVRMQKLGIRLSRTLVDERHHVES
jgi:formate hydrogenlyase transcriptional activator